MVLRVHKSSPNETFAITSTNVQSWNALGVVDWSDAFACLHQFTKISKKNPVGIFNERFHRLSKNICFALQIATVFGNDQFLCHMFVRLPHSSIIIGAETPYGQSQSE